MYINFCISDFGATEIAVRASRRLKESGAIGMTLRHNFHRLRRRPACRVAGAVFLTPQIAVHPAQTSAEFGLHPVKPLLNWANVCSRT